MKKRPFLSHEINLDKLKCSTINSNENKYFCYVGFENNQCSEQSIKSINLIDKFEPIYLQTPLFKFIQPVQLINSYNELYLFLTPQDSTTFDFVEFINNIESKLHKHIQTQIKHKLMLSSVIKNYTLSDIDTDSTQIIMYLKIKLLNQTKIMYDDQFITINQLNKLIGVVNLKLIFEINMIWITQNKIGIYLKPIKIKAIDQIIDLNIDFRDDDDNILPNENTHTEIENITKIFKTQSIMSFNDSVFEQKSISNNKCSNICTESSVHNVNTFIPSSGTNTQIPDLQKQLKNKLFILKTKHNVNSNNLLTSSNSIKSNKSDKSNKSNKTSDLHIKRTMCQIIKQSESEPDSDSICSNNDVISDYNSNNYNSNNDLNDELNDNSNDDNSNDDNPNDDSNDNSNDDNSNDNSNDDNSNDDSNDNSNDDDSNDNSNDDDSNDDNSNDDSNDNSNDDDSNDDNSNDDNSNDDSNDNSNDDDSNDDNSNDDSNDNDSNNNNINSISIESDNISSVRINKYARKKILESTNDKIEITQKHFINNEIINKKRGRPKLSTKKNNLLKLKNTLNNSSNNHQNYNLNNSKKIFKNNTETDSLDININELMIN